VYRILNRLSNYSSKTFFHEISTVKVESILSFSTKKYFWTNFQLHFLYEKTSCRKFLHMFTYCCDLYLWLQMIPVEIWSVWKMANIEKKIQNSTFRRFSTWYWTNKNVDRKVLKSDTTTEIYCSWLAIDFQSFLKCLNFLLFWHFFK